MKKDRIYAVDYLRGVSIVIVILIHTNAYFLSNKLAHFIWDWAEWAVPVFIFCSSFVFFQKPFAFSFPALFSYVKKRTVRLLLPYYIFLCAFLPVIFIGEPKKATFKSFIDSITLSGTVDINWLIVLFLYFSFLMPILSFFYHKKRILFWIYTFFSFASSVYFMYFSAPLHHKFTMWLPWSLVIVFTILLVNYEKKKFFLPVFIVLSGIVFLITQYIHAKSGHNLLHYYNKYPPNFYHLSYGIFSTALFYGVAKTGVFDFSPLKQILMYLSRSSYSLYFIHYLVIFYITIYMKPLRFDWISFFYTVLLVTLTIQFIIDTAHYLFSTLKRGPTI